MRGGYHVVDEPMPGRLAESVVSPSWCLFAVMFGGTWLSWPWFVWNGFALGSPTRRREAVWAAAGFVGAVAYLFVLGFLLDEGLLPDAAAPYGLLLLSTWKVTVSYLLYKIGRAHV